MLQSPDLRSICPAGGEGYGQGFISDGLTDDRLKTIS